MEYTILVMYIVHWIALGPQFTTSRSNIFDKFYKFYFYGGKPSIFFPFGWIGDQKKFVWTLAPQVIFGKNINWKKKNKRCPDSNLEPLGLYYTLVCSLYPILIFLKIGFQTINS